MGYEPLHHKYRPQTFADLVGQEAIATTLTNAILTQRIAPAYLLTGARGTGKTSTARILAKSLNCLSYDVPTPKPCGTCDMCRNVTKGIALDVTEIDAASNTGVDNIRELIERAQFAPVQARYKVYAIDECLTGDSLVLTNSGLMRIDDPAIKGKKVLSYNDISGIWEYKKVLRWLDRGVRQTLIIKTVNREIRCTTNHLIRTDRGWIPAQDVKEGMKILSPVPVVVERLFAPEAPQVFTCVRKDTQLQKIKLLPIGLQSLAIRQSQETTESQEENNPTTPFIWEQLQAKNGCQTSGNIQSHLWTTNLEHVESVRISLSEQVYDIEVEDNHNFVANGLLVHNCHMLSTAAFNALLKTLEEPPDRVTFILATTDPQRVLPTIISRCQRFDFRRIPLEAMVSHLRKIADLESIRIAQEAIVLVAQIAQGGLRDAESLLDQLSLMEGEITVEAVWDLVGSVPERDLLGLLEAIATDNGTQVLEQLRRVMDRGREPLIVLQNLAGLYRDLLIAKSAPERNDLVALTASGWTRLKQLVQPLSMPTILAGQQHLRSAEGQIKNTTQPRLWLEVTLLGLLPAAIAVNESVRSSQATQLTAVKPAPATTANAKVAIDTQPIVASDRESQVTPPPIVATLPGSPSQTDLEVPRREEDPVKPGPAVPSPIVAPPVVAEPVVASHTASVNLESAWQELMAYLLPTTRALLAEHGRFVEVSQNIVKIGFKSSALKKIAEEQKRDEITKSCGKVFGYSVQVVFGIVNAKAATGSTSQKASLSSSPVGNRQEPRASQQIATANSQPASLIPTPVSQPATKAVESLEGMPSNFNALQSPEEQAIKNVAQFFAGQIVNLDDENN